MAACPSCGRENEAGARFCSACGTALAVEAPREVRKTVTILFCDMTGSTALGERLDPEATRRLMARYFESAREILEQARRFVSYCALPIGQQTGVAA